MRVIISDASSFPTDMAFGIKNEMGDSEDEVSVLQSG